MIQMKVGDMKRVLAGVMASVCLISGSVAVYGADQQKLQPVSQEVVECSTEMARAQADELAEKLQQKAEKKHKLEIKKAKKKAAKKAAIKAEKARVAERQRVVDYALQFVGNPYVYGGTSLTNGADCSGFVQSVFRDCGYSLPRVAASQAYSGTQKSMEELEVGDLLFYGYGGSITHVALYIGDNQIVHASTAATGIKVSEYNYQQPCMVASYLA